MVCGLANGLLFVTFTVTVASEDSDEPSFAVNSKVAVSNEFVAGKNITIPFVTMVLVVKFSSPGYW